MTEQQAIDLLQSVANIELILKYAFAILLLYIAFRFVWFILWDLLFSRV